MLFTTQSALVGVLALLAAAPASAGVVQLAERASVTCPSVWANYDFETVILSTTTLTDTYSSLGHVTSTKTEKETITISTISTIYSPATVTASITTFSPTVATVTERFSYFLSTSTTTVPGYAPSASCTYTATIPGTSTLTITNSLLYESTWYSTTGHVTTTTESYYKSVTRYYTTPGTTVYDTTVTEPQTFTWVDLTVGTVWETAWESGCSAYACKA